MIEGAAIMVLDLSRLFHPRNVAVVGASPVPAAGRFDYLDWLSQSGFPGDLYPVNPRYPELRGRRCYPSLRDIPGEVDLAILMVPADKTVELLRDMPAGKLGFAVVVTSGFSEIGETELQRELVSVARARGIRVVGPNCMGIYSRRGRLVQFPDQPCGPGPGQLAAAGQSGGNALNIVRACVQSGIVAAYGASVGNQSDLCLEDFFEWFDSQEEVKVIAAYVEDVKRGPEFLGMAREISLHKPIIVWKGGTTHQGCMAAASHTGALAMPNEIWEGMTRQAGIVPADSVTDIMNLSRALLWETLPQGPNVGLISPGGGASVILTDCSIRAGLGVPLLEPSTQAELSSFIARVNTIIHNPVDLGAASYLPQTLERTLKVMGRDKAIHALILYQYISPSKDAGGWELYGRYLTAVQEARRSTGKPVYVVLFGPFQNFPEVDQVRREIKGLLHDLKIPYADDLESCTRMVRRVWDYSRWLRTRKGEGAIVGRAASN